MASDVEDAKRLAAAILNCAAKDIRSKQGKAKGEAMAWVRSKDNKHTFSFEGCCHILDIEVESARKSMVGRQE